MDSCALAPSLVLSSSNTKSSGVLSADEMGFGKTATCIALVLSTRGELPDARSADGSLPPVKAPDLDEPVLFYVSQTPTTLRPRKAEQSARAPPPRIRLTAATLVVLPDSVFSQWESELAKHVQRGFLKSASFRDVQLLTLAEVTADLDLVLITFDLLGKALKQATETSPLWRCHWKRLIIDEGHTFANNNGSNRQAMAQQVRSFLRSHS